MAELRDRLGQPVLVREGMNEWMKRSAWATGSSERGNGWMERSAWATGSNERGNG